MLNPLLRRVTAWGLLIAALSVTAYATRPSSTTPAQAAPTAEAMAAIVRASAAAPATSADTVVFAGGCFWSMQKAFDHVDGVTETMAGYAGGTVADPSYEQVETGRTGHAESVRVIYDPTKLRYANLINAYVHRIDPTDGGGTFCDRGPQYRPVIFVRDSTHRKIAEASLAALGKVFEKPIAVQVMTSSAFYPAEEYHQEYYKKNPTQYDRYRVGCGRDEALDAAWKGKSFPPLPN